MRETMHKAFWDSVMESLKQEEPNYDRVLQLVREVHDELCNMAPGSWKQEITEAFDIDFLSQVLIIDLCLDSAGFIYCLIFQYIYID